jgi:micrococcal nuclease
MSTENRSQWSTVKVIVLCLLASALAFYEGSRLDLFTASGAQPVAAQHPPKTERLQTEEVKRDNAPHYFRVAQVIEGDVVKLDDGTEVNLIGVSCPKLDDTDPLQVALAHEAVAFTTGAITAKQVRLEYEPAHSFDGRGRTLAYVYLQDGTFLNAELIKHGYGSAFARYTYRFTDDFHRDEIAARNAKIGQWETREVETAEINNGSSESTTSLASAATSEETDTANRESPASINLLPTPTRSRVVQPITLSSRASADNEDTQQSYSSTSVETPSRSYSSPSYISPSIAPAYRPSVAENGSVYGEISERTGRPKTVYVRSYTRRDGTYVRSYWRSAPR